MQLYTVIILPDAEHAIRLRAAYIVKRSGFVNTARKWVTKTKKFCYSLSRFPYRGRDRSDIYPNLRTIPHDGDIVAYTIDETTKTVYVVALTGPGQNFESLLKGTLSDAYH